MSLHDSMERLGLSPELIELAPSRELEDPCIVRCSVGDGPRTIYFHGHFDVVPAQDPAQFRPVRRDGRITGRGTADMKGGLVSMLYGALAARELALLEGRRIVLHFVCDEETGSVAGSGHLRAAGLIDPEAVAMLTAEPTGGVVWHACRGAITLRVQTSGREAHVGYVHQGINAFEHMIRIAEPLTVLSHELLDKRTKFPVESEEAAGSMLVVGGQAGAGAGFNAVPGSAWFSVDRRFNPEEELEQELARLTGMINEAADAAGAKVDIDVLQEQPSGSTDQTHPAARDAGSMHRRRGRRPTELPDVPRRARHSLVLTARHPGLRLRRGSPGHLPRTRRVHRRSGHAPLRRRLRPLARTGAAGCGARRRRTSEMLTGCAAGRLQNADASSAACWMSCPPRTPRGLSGAEVLPSRGHDVAS